MQVWSAVLVLTAVPSTPALTRYQAPFQCCAGQGPLLAQIVEAILLQDAALPYTLLIFSTMNNFYPSLEAGEGLEVGGSAGKERPHRAWQCIWLGHHSSSWW